MFRFFGRAIHIGILIVLSTAAGVTGLMGIWGYIGSPIAQFYSSKHMFVHLH